LWEQVIFLFAALATATTSKGWLPGPGPKKKLGSTFQEHFAIYAFEASRYILSRLFSDKINFLAKGPNKN